MSNRDSSDKTDEQRGYHGVCPRCGFTAFIITRRTVSLMGTRCPRHIPDEQPKLVWRDLPLQSMGISPHTSSLSKRLRRKVSNLYSAVSSIAAR